MSVATIENFYEAFNNLDAKTMCSFYHDAIVFEDPAFGKLQGDRAKAMWFMLCESQQGKSFKVEASDITANSAHWEAYYTFSKTGRRIHNRIDASFEFKDGLIIKHSDHFNLHRWAKQALGFKGLILGGTGFFKSKLNKQTNYLLDKYINKKAI
ncbi:MAG: nuclear transport factor 2 family protein [Winogradskyella sp.]